MSGSRPGINISCKTEYSCHESVILSLMGFTTFTMSFWNADQTVTTEHYRAHFFKLSDALQENSILRYKSRKWNFTVEQDVTEESGASKRDWKNISRTYDVMGFNSYCIFIIEEKHISNKNRDKCKQQRSDVCLYLKKIKICEQILRNSENILLKVLSLGIYPSEESSITGV